MSSYHVNPATGEPKKCRAKIQCPFGGSDAHYADKNTARQAYEKTQCMNSALEGSKLASEITKYPASTYEEVRDFRNDAIKNADVKGEILGTYSMMAKSVIKDHPDAATIALHATEFGVDVAVVHDSYGSQLGEYSVYDEKIDSTFDEASPSVLLTQLVDQAGNRGDDHTEAWGSAFDEARKLFKDKDDKGWKSSVDAVQIDLAAAADWNPKESDTPEREFKKVNDFREEAKKSGNVKDEIVSTYSMMAKSLVKEYPGAASVEVMANDEGERFHMRIYDTNGSVIASKPIDSEPHPSDPENSSTRLIANLYGDGNGWRGDDFNEELGDALTEADNVFRDKERKDWHSEIHHDRWDLTAAAAWKPSGS